MRVSPSSTDVELGSLRSIVEFATADDAARAKNELADKAFMGRSVFIREVRLNATGEEGPALTWEDREEAARFGQAPIPGKMGVANGESRHFLGQAARPDNRNLFIGNVSLVHSPLEMHLR